MKKTALHWAVIVVPILASVLLAVASRRTVGQRWVMLRAAAESIKAEICRYRTLRVTFKDGQAAVSPAGQRQLVSQLDAIKTRLMQTEVSGSPSCPNDTLQDQQREQERKDSPDGAAGKSGAQEASTQ